MRRLVDVLVSTVASVVLAPVMALIAVLVRRQLGSPVLFLQRRSGLLGKEFTIYKFRTMRAEAFPGEPDAARDTPLGRTLRGSSLDELPQLWNVAKGDMSLIGPRPTLPEQVVHYSERQRGRLAVRPGITGWAQVKVRNSASWPERIELDLDYIRSRSVALDLQIVGLTLLRLVKPSGLYGEGGVNQGFPVSSPGSAHERD